MKLRILLVSCMCLLIAIISVCSWSAYSYYQMIHTDDPVTPTLRVMEGWAKIIRWDLAIELMRDETYTLESWDAVETARDSIGVVTWPDHSITRLGPLTRIEIHKMLAELGYEKIEIAFSLKKWKIWSTIVRTLIGDSYFETTLPKNDIVAWVRGTIYEINLERGYIHAVNHAVTLRDSSAKSLILMPGELVDSENIWIKKWKKILDNAWVHINTEYDKAYVLLRSSQVTSSLIEASHNIFTWYDWCIRWILGHFDTFQMLRIEDRLRDGDTISLARYTPDFLMSYYQRIQGLPASISGDTLRSVLYEQVQKSGSWMQWLLSSLRMGALWESLDTGELLPGARKILNTQTELIGENLDNLQTILTKQHFSDEIEKSLRHLLGGN